MRPLNNDRVRLIARVPPASLQERLERLKLAGETTNRVVVDEVCEWLSDFPNISAEQLKYELLPSEI